MKLNFLRTNKESKIKNFQQVESVLRQLKVKFDAKLINQIMNEERGASLRLLYQMKLAIQKQTGDSTQTFQKTITGLDPATVNKKFEEVMQLKTTLPMTSKLQTMNKSKKLEPIEKTLLKFEQTKRVQEDKAFKDQKKEEELINSLFQDERQKQLKTMKENQQFMKEWMDEGKKNWKVNQQKRQETINRQKYFEDKEVEAYKNKLMKELDEATKEMMGGIDEFEKNLQKLGIEKNTNIEDAKKRMEEKKGVPPGQIQNFSYAASMNKIKEKKSLADFAAKERDRRRRKMIVDQAKTQSELDKKKNEELLIQKLMKKQAEEQQFAYLEWRNYQCKEIVIKNRETKALSFEEKKKAQIEELERKRNEEYAQVIENHKKQIQDQKKFYQTVRREEKLAKRRVNIEVCSEVIDLILDVANEAYEKSLKKQNRKLDKPLWREWMKIFNDGKLVSLVAGENSMNLSQQLMDDETKDQVYDPLQDHNKQLEDLLDEMKYDPAYEDLLQYLSVTGMFNLDSEPFKLEWNGINDINTLEGLNINFEFLESLIPSSNPELGRNLQQLLLTIFNEEKTEKSFKIELKKEEGIPHHLPIKLCLLGRKYAGKRTIAKQIQEQFQNKVKVFKMEDLIKECVDYVNPRPVQTESTLQKKGPAPKKGAEEPQFVDQYAGQDTKEYKEIGHQLKQILGDNFDFAQHQASSQQDLISLITDESLLIRLFIQKLKLTFPPEKSDAAKVEEIKQGLAREKEILEQLSEIEQNQAQAPGNEKGKAPAKAPAKGKPTSSNEDQLKQELDQITKISPEGWILLDFPRTLNQAKLMEKLITGYTCPTDEDKSLELRRFEQWSKLVTPSSISTQDSFDGEPSIYQAAADGIIFLDVPSEECFRRSQHRKIDPQTGTIYHLEDNPPPEGDIKLRDRLQEYSDPDTEYSKMSHNHMVYEENSQLLKKWFSSFGLKDDSLKGVQAVSSLIEVGIEQKTKKEEVQEKLFKQLSNLISFKQAQFDYKRQQVKLAMTQEMNQLDNSQIQAPEQQEQYTLPEQNSVDQVVAHQQSTQQDEIDMRKSKSVIQSSHSQRLRSGGYGSEKPLQPLSNAQKKDIWTTFEHTYYRESLQVFKAIRRQRDLVFEGLNDIQKRFFEFLQRQDNKQQKIHAFVDSFNKFSEEFPDLREDEQTKQELLNRVDNLSNDLWSIIEKRKDEALEEHQRISTNGWIQHEMRKLIRNAITVFQNEINKFSTIYRMIVGYEPAQAIYVEQQFNTLVDQGNPPIQDGVSPLLQKLMGYILRVLQYQSQSQSSLESSIKVMLDKEIENTIFRLNMINTWISLKVKEFEQQSSSLFNILDDWVLVAVQIENEQAQQVCQRLRQSIIERVSRLDPSQFTLEGDNELYDQIQMLTFSSEMPPLYLQNVSQPNDLLSGRFKVEHLEILYKDMLYFSFDEYLDGQTFIHLIVLCLKENRAPIRWRYFEFSIFNSIIKRFQVAPLGHQTQSLYNRRDSQQQAEREFVDWRMIFSMFILLQTVLPEQADEIDSYQQSLFDAAGETGELTLQTFINIPAWFDGYESVPEQQSSKRDTQDDDYGDEEVQEVQDYERVVRIKTLLFKTHQRNTGVLRVSDFSRYLGQIYSMARGSTCFNALFNI